MAKIRLTSPTFDASAKTVTHPSFSDVGLSGIQLIVNVTDQIIIYNFADTTKGGTLAGDVLTLEYDTTSMSDTDELMVLVEDGIAYQIPTGAATAARQDTLIAQTDNVETLLTAIDGRVDGLETIGGATNTKLDTVISHLDGVETLLTEIESVNQEQGTVYTPSKVAVAGGVRQDAGGSPAGVDDGDVHPFLFNEEGRLKVSAQPAIYSPTIGNITANGQTVSIDVSRASNIMFHCTGTFSTVNVAFEGSIDGGTTWFGVQAVRSNANTIETTSGNLSAAPAYAWEASVNALTNFRVRATAFTSGTQTWRLLPGAYATEPIPAAQISGTQPVSGTVAATMAANATTTPVKARDSVSGASDTAIPPLFVRRDTPTAVTPIAGDYEFAQISANGEQWVRQQGELPDDAAFTLGTTRVLPIGAVAVAMDGTDPTTASAEGDAVVPRADLNRILIVNQTHPRFFRAAVDYASAQTNATVVAAPGAGLSLYITDIVISNGATAGNITLLNGSGGSLLFEVYPAVNGGVAHSFRNPIKLTDNTLLALTSTTVTTHAITVTGYIAA